MNPPARPVGSAADTGRVGDWQGEQNRQQPGWSPGQVRVVWAEDGEEYLETVALGWTGRNVYVRMPGPRYRFTAVWLDAADVTRR